MKKIITLLIISFFGNTYAQITETCATGTIKLKTQNHQYGILEWQTSQDGVKWDNIHNAHDTTYVFTTSKAAYYRAVNKFPSCDPIISSVTLVQRPPVANAGQDRLVNDVELYLGANSAIGSTGTWSILQGTGGVLLNPNNPNSKFTGITGSYKLLWTLQNSCGVSTDTVDVKFKSNQYHPKIVIVDNTDVLQSTPAQVSNGNYIIQFSSPVPVIDNQTILVGTVGNGYLRKVNSVTQSGNTFTMATSQGKLKDLFVDGGFELGNIFKIDTILPASRMANHNRLSRIPTRAEILSNPNLKTGKHFFIVKDSVTSSYNGISMQRVASTTTNPDNPEFSFTFNNTVVNQGGFNCHLNGGLTFTPNVYADFEKTLLHTTFNVGLNNATVVSNYQFSITNTTSTNLFDHDFSLYTYNRLVYFLIGGVPVLVNVGVDFNGKASAQINTNLSFVHSFQNTVTTNAGLSYNDGVWSNHYNNTVNTTVDNNLNISGNLTQNFEIGPKMTFMFYDIIGPYADAKLTEDLDICASTVNAGALNWKANLNLGAKFTLGARAEILENQIFDYSKTWEDRELYTVNFPYTIEYHSGNNQHYTNGTPMTNPIKVRVMSNKGFAVPGAVVKFEPFAGSGTVSSTYVVTDFNGYAQTSWSPTGTGISKLSAIVQDCNQNNISNSPLFFQATEVTSIDCTQTTLYADYVISGNTISPTAHMGVPPYTYSTDAVNFSSTIPQIAMTTGGNYSATVKDSNGCIAVMNYYNGPVNCNNSGLNLQTSVYGSSIQASAQGGNPPYLFALDNGSYSAISTFNSFSIGNHLIRVKDANNCVRQSIISISNSTNDLVSYFNINNYSFSTNFPIEFTNLSNNANTYLWNFGDSNTSTLTNPTHFYNSPGTFTITLTAYNGVNSHIYSKTITVTSPTNNNLGIVTVPIPAGTFIMGSPSTEPNRATDEIQHQVTLSAFQMSKYEITCAQYASFLNAVGAGSNAIWTTGPYPTQTLTIAVSNYGLTYANGQWTPVIGKDNTPMINVNWYGAVSFAQYVGGRLPTESEWEYATRGGTSTTFNTGGCLSNVQDNYDWSNPQTGCTNSITNYLGTTQIVGTYPANPYGLQNMHGNVREWCADWYGTYPSTATTNPTGNLSGTNRVLRGGGWGSFAKSCRSAYRNRNSPAYTNYDLGFRIVF